MVSDGGPGRHRLRGVLMGADGRLRSGWRLLLFLLAVPAVGLCVWGIRRLFGLRVTDSETGDVGLPWGLLVHGMLAIGFTVGLLYVFLQLLERRSLATLGLPLRRPWLGGIGVGLALGALPVVLLVVGMAAAGRADVALALPGGTELIWSWLPLTIGLALVSAQEELVLRGYVLQLLAEGTGRWPAAIATGVLFGLAHAANPGANPVGIVNTAVNAVLLAWLVFRTGSLWIACGYHAGWNVVGAMVFGMRLSGLVASPSFLLDTRLRGPAWMTGGEYGFEGSALVGVSELVVLAVTLAFAQRLPGHPEMVQYFEPRRGAGTPVDERRRSVTSSSSIVVRWAGKSPPDGVQEQGLER